MAARLINPDAGSYASLRSGFAWNVPETFNMASACVEHDPDDLALISIDETGESVRTTFGEVDRLSSALAAHLQAAGIERGDRIGVVVPQSLDTAVAHLACWKLGAISIPLASLFGPDALAYRLHDAAASMVISSPENLQKVADGAPDVAVIDTRTDLPAIFDSDDGSFTAVVTRAEDPAFIIYTSGTTGSPKGALHAHRSLFGHLPGFELYYEYAPRDGDVIWTPADWAWIGGLMDVLVPAWFHGIPVVTSSATFDPQGAIDLMRRHAVTLTFLPPTALKMMRSANVDTSGLALRAIFTGGEALGESLQRWAADHLGVPINEGYGQTEANLVAGNCASTWPVRPGSMGRALPGHEVEVHDAEGNRVVEEVGEICVRSPDPVMMIEYWNRPEETAAKFDGAWLLTGDLGREDEEGYLWFESRADDVIISAGYRIGPGEIEASLMSHPAVGMCAVVGVPDDTRGEVPAAWIVLRPDQTPSLELADELKNHVRTRLAAHEVPRRVTFVDDLPTTTTGKIMRRALRGDDTTDAGA